MKNQPIVEQSYWDNSYKQLNLFKADKNDPLIIFFEANFSSTMLSDKSVFEIGCYPGRYLAYFGDKGSLLNGIDLTPKVSTELTNWLISNNYPIGQFHHDNIENFKSSNQYDVVCSFGFIEHFENWEEIIEIHHKLLKPGGTLIITVPNFKGLFQYYAHLFLDKENLDRHNVKSMNPKKWAKLLEKLNYEVQFQGPFGNFDFWVDNQSRTQLQESILKYTTHKLVPYLKKRITKNHFSYSPYLGIIATKR